MVGLYQEILVTMLHRKCILKCVVVVGIPENYALTLCSRSLLVNLEDLLVHAFDRCTHIHLVYVDVFLGTTDELLDGFRTEKVGAFLCSLDQ